MLVLDGDERRHLGGSEDATGLRDGGVGDSCGGSAKAAAETTAVGSTLIGIGRGVAGQDLDELLVLGVGERGVGVAEALGDLINDVSLRCGFFVLLVLREPVGAECALDLCIDLGLGVLYELVDRAAIGNAFGSGGHSNIALGVLFFNEEIFKGIELFGRQIRTARTLEEAFEKRGVARIEHHLFAIAHELNKLRVVHQGLQRFGAASTEAAATVVAIRRARWFVGRSVGGDFVGLECVEFVLQVVRAVLGVGQALFEGGAVGVGRGKRGAVERAVELPSVDAGSNRGEREEDDQGSLKT